MIDAAGVDVTGSGHPPVRGLTWVVRPGEFWVLGGEHGSGKTDVLLTAAGLRRPAAGKLQIWGRDFAALGERELEQQRARIGFVFKGGGRMFSNLTVAENIALPLCYHRGRSMEDCKPDIDALLELSGLTSVAEEPAQLLRGDLQHRVGLARALAMKPELLFLDEPAFGLGPSQRKWWQQAATQLNAGQAPGIGHKITIVIATSEFAHWHGENRRYCVIQKEAWRELDAEEKNFEFE